MSILDLIILILLAGFVWKGIKLGLIEVIGSIIGLFVGVFLAGHYYQEVGEMILGLLFGSQILANVLGFLLVFILVNRAIALVFWFIDKIFHIVAIIPFLKSFNHLLGGIFGLLEGFIFLGIIFYFLSFVPFTGGLQDRLEQSKFAGVFETVGKIASPFMPESIKDWRSFLPDMPGLPGGIDLDDIPLNSIGYLLDGNPDINLD